MKPRLITYNQLPEWLQFNPFVWSGYRPVQQNFWRLSLSIWEWHNETVRCFRAQRVSCLIGAVFARWLVSLAVVSALDACYLLSDLHPLSLSLSCPFV